MQGYLRECQNGQEAAADTGTAAETGTDSTHTALPSRIVPPTQLFVLHEHSLRVGVRSHLRVASYGKHTLHLVPIGKEACQLYRESITRHGVKAVHSGRK